MFCALAENMEFFRDKLNLFVAFAPVVRLDNCTSGLIKMLKDTVKLENMFKKYKVFELTPLKQNNKGFYYFHKLFPEISRLGIQLLSDENPKEINRVSLEAFLAHYPSGTSLKSILHFKQIMNKKSFQHFDYGKEENLKRYE